MPISEEDGDRLSEKYNDKQCKKFDNGHRLRNKIMDKVSEQKDGHANE